MTILLLAQQNHDSLFVAVGLMIIFAVIILAAIYKYEIDGVVKIFAGMGSLMGLITGAMGTYYFTKDTVEAKESQIKPLQSALTASEKEKVEAGKQIQTLVESIKPAASAAAAQGEPAAAETVKKLEDVSRTLKDTSTITVPPPTVTSTPSATSPSSSSPSPSGTL